MKNIYAQSDIKFREKQRFKQTWLWFFIIIIALLAWFGFVYQVIFGKPFGNNPAPDFLMWIFLIVFGIVFPLFFHYITLVVELTPEHIHIRFWPFLSRRIVYSDIKNCEARKYNPMWEYGGWGIRYAFKKGWAYNVSGNMGVQLELKDDRRILIGSQDAETLNRLIKESMPGKT